MKYEYKITSYNNGWYNFEDLPQENNYIKICNLNCSTNSKAINQARKIIGNKKAIIIITT